MVTIYLDHAATTPIDAEVLQVMIPYFTKIYGNPSSVHMVGQAARRAVDLARNTVAEILKCSPREIIFTGSGTESDNLAIKGICLANQKKGNHIITSQIEHSAVLKTIEYLEANMGFKVTCLKPNECGLINPQEIANAIQENTIFCSIMYANNEVGTINSIKEIGEICRDNNVIFHTDACQAACSLSLDVNELNVDLMTINGSKIYGPKGIGVLYKKAGIDLVPMIFGGEGQEHRLRSGTENTPAIVGMAKALELIKKNKEKENERLIKLREYFINEILKKIPNVILNGHASLRLPNNINLSFVGVSGESLLMQLDLEGICVASGSACTSGSLDPSHVLLAIGKTYDDANSAIRITLGHGNTKKELDFVIQKFVEIVENLRKISPIY